jgi:aromatic ring hydroxylase
MAARTGKQFLRGLAGAEQRSRLFRLAWDFAATALGNRNEQYERFYLGSVGRSLTMLQTNGDRTRANRLLDRFLTEELETGWSDRAARGRAEDPACERL